jgi:hypothetical protein
LSAEGALALAAIAGGLIVLQGTVRRLVPRRDAIACGVLLLFGTGLGWTVVPAPDARAATAFLLSALGVAWAGRMRPRMAGLGGAALLLAAAVGVSLGAERGRLEAPRVVEALFSSRHGLLFWNPVLWASLVGWPLLVRRDRWFGGALLAGLGTAGLVVSGCPAGESGPWAARRWTPILPLMAPALAVALDALVKTAARRPDRLLAAAGALLVGWNLLFMEQYRTGGVPRDGTVSFVAVAANNAALLSRLVGSPPAWPANWAFAWRHRLPADRFDLVAGKRLPVSAEGQRDIDIGDLPLDTALLLEGWSVRHPCGSATCRAVEGRARLLAPLEATGRFDLAVYASGEGRLSVAVNGVSLGAQALSPGRSALRFPAPRPWATLNEVTLTLEPGGRALVDRVRLAPPGSAS